MPVALSWSFQLSITFLASVAFSFGTPALLHSYLHVSLLPSSSALPPAAARLHGGQGQDGVSGAVWGNGRTTT